MNWNKYSLEDRKVPGMSILAILLLIVSLYMQSKLVMFLAIFFLTILICNQMYLKRVGTELFFENITEKKFHFVDNKGQWLLSFQNNGYPILKGELRVYFDDVVAPDGMKQDSSLSMYDLSIPFSLYTKQTKQIIIPYTAKKRGIARIRKLELHVPSLVGFGETILESPYTFKQQAVVYPLSIPVKGLKVRILSKQLDGNTFSDSVYEDLLSPVGTRDYVPSDSFNRINWKASARKQTLQTKVFEKISDRGWNISLNISNGHSITGELEELLSSITEIAYFACYQQIPYSLCINVRIAGTTPFLYLPIGEGKEHLQKVLETLASISTQNTSIPYENMLSFYHRHLPKQPFFFHAGVRTKETTQMLLYMSRRDTKLYTITVEKDYGVLRGLEFHHEGRVRI